MRVIYALGLLLVTVSLNSAAVVPAANQVDLIEFYNKSLDHYFVTAHKNEIADLDTGIHVGWARTGYSFPVVKLGATEAATSPTCRFYGRPEAKIDSHFYSSKVSECEDVKLKFPEQWQFESEEVFRAFAVDPNTGKCPTDTSPVYRLWNQRPDVNHRYTNQLSVYQEMVAKGYKPEGDGNPLLPVAFCQPSGGSVVPPPPTGSPACTLSSPTLTPALGTSQILTATCTNTPTSYIWSGCTSTTSTCTVTKSTAGTVVYAVAGTNAAGTGATVTRSLNWGGVAGAVPQCTISSNTATPTVGGVLTLSSNCSQSPTRIDWLACSYEVVDLCSYITTCSTTATSCAVTQSNVGLARYAVSGTNAAGTGPKSTSVEVAWTAGGGGGGGGGTAPSCTAYASDANQPAGTTVTLSAYCFNNPVSYSWTGLGLIQNSGMNVTANYPIAGNQTYGVTATNGAGSGQAFVNVNWGGSSGPPVPNCTLTSSNLAPIVGQSITLTSSCTNSPTTYVWTNCTSSGPTCVDAATAVVGGKIYTVTASNGAGAGNTAQVLVAWQPAPTAPPVCTVAPSDPAPYTGQLITLTASCSQSPIAGSYIWTGCTSTQSTCTTTSAAAGPLTYTVTAANGLGTSTPASTLVNWQQSTGGIDFCPGYPNVSSVSRAWNDNLPILTGNNGGFAGDGVFVIAFTVPPSPASYGSPGFTDIAEYQGVPTFRTMTLSKSACDFRPMDPTGVSGPYRYGYGNSAQIYWNAGAAPVSLVPGQTYYFNFRNFNPDTGANTCATSNCNAVIQIHWPG